MKIGLVFAAVALGSLGFSSAIAGEETLENKGVIEAKLDAKTKKVSIVIKGKDGVYVNKEYPMKCSLTIASGGKLEKAEVKKEDAVFDDVAGKAGKAKSATFKVGADKAVTGECKMVLCTDSSCSSPFKMNFTST